jgi:hypothetical protein
VQRLVVVALLLAGCGKHAAPVAGPDMAFVPAFAAHDKVDILFMIDNSNGEAYKNELRNRFPQLVQALQQAGADHPASYHIGVVTSDLGAGPYVLNQGQCHPDGDGGKLQVGPNPMATNVPANCQGFNLKDGARFIEYDQIAGTTNLVGVSQISDAFNCMSAVGGAGCGFEHQLESTYRALHDDVPENAGFLREDALLVVFYATDEDDCSGTPDDDLFDPSDEGKIKYGVLHSFRCTQFGVICGQPPMMLSASTASGPFSDCRPMRPDEGGKLIDVQKYIDYFARPGGVKADPSDVILAGIMAPPAPVGVQITMPCADQTNTPACPFLNNSCVAANSPALFGAPAVRLSAVVDAALTSQRTTLCETDYSDAVAGLANKIIARLK